MATANHSVLWWVYVWVYEMEGFRVWYVMDLTFEHPQIYVMNLAVLKLL
jgi:hypothetical protein